MAILNILEFPDLRLRRKATPVVEFTPELSRTIDDMFETMYAAPGIGLAATQVNIHKQLIVIDISDNKDTPLVFINPRIEIIDQTLEDYDEGCLSVPGFYETVSRPRMVRIHAQDRHGEPFVIETDGLLATCIQHEMDHLQGKVFVERLSELKQNRIRAKLKKRQRKAA